MLHSIEDIKKPVNKELISFEKHFKGSMKSQVPLLDKITYYIVQRKGKQIRPMLVFLTAKMFGAINESTYIAASLVELLHTATLVHEYVVDDAYKRRGFFSINALWKNKIAVLVGDYLLSRGLLIAIDNNEFKILKIVSQAVRDMSEGELLQMEKARKLDIEETIYFDIIRKKTASLLSAACCAGASSIIKDEELLEKVRQFGEKLGMAYQIKDDLFDYGDFDIGKPRGIDIKEKKMTLPLIHTLEKADKSKKRWIKNIVKNHNTDKQKVAELIKFVKESGGLEYGQKTMIKYQEEALQILNEFPDSESKESLRKLLLYVTERKK